MHTGLAIVKGLSLLPLAPAVYLLMLLFLGVQYQRAQMMERSVLGLKVSLFVGYWWKSLLYGMIMGIAISGGMYLIRHYFSFTWSVTLSWELWIVFLLLALIDVRLADIAIVGPVVILLCAGLLMIPSTHFWWLPTLDQLRSLLFIAGATQLFVGILGIINGGRYASPLYVKSKRGQVVGMFISQMFWPIPLLLPSTGMILPAVIFTGINSYSISSPSARIIHKKGQVVLLIGLLVLAGSVLLGTSMVSLLIIAVASLLLRTGLLQIVQILERGGLPIYVQPARGVRVLASLARSPSAQLGLQAGEIILKIGNILVNSPYDIHFAIDQNPAYVKLEVVDARGESRFIGTPIFADGPSQLGVVVVPDAYLYQYREVYSLGQWNWIWRWWAKDPNKMQSRYRSSVMTPSENQSL